jgi:hypothetical protein
MGVSIGGERDLQTRSVQQMCILDFLRHRGHPAVPQKLGGSSSQRKGAAIKHLRKDCDCACTLVQYFIMLNSFARLDIQILYLYNAKHASNIMQCTHRRTIWRRFRAGIIVPSPTPNRRTKIRYIHLMLDT